ncbi:MAG: 4-hydroxybenzoyl-CoA reductase, partial [Deltaproteobacteria bacterium]
MSDFSILGGRHVRLDAADKACGRAEYTDDIVLPGMLHAAILRSPHAHARVLSVDVSGALRIPGVKAVITAKDVPDVWFGVSPARYDEKVFLGEKVLYVGDEVAAVAAVDRDTAKEALEAIKVEYEPLPEVLDARKALEPGAPQIHPLYPGNLNAEVDQEFGDVAEARSKAVHVVEGRLESEMQDAAFLEPQAVIARFDHDGRLEVICSTQSVHYLQRAIAMVLGMSPDRVRVRKPCVGGGFGPKAGPGSHELIACLLAGRMAFDAYDEADMLSVGVYFGALALAYA